MDLQNTFPFWGFLSEKGGHLSFHGPFYSPFVDVIKEFLERLSVFLKINSISPGRFRTLARNGNCCMGFRSSSNGI